MALAEALVAGHVIDAGDEPRPLALCLVDRDGSELPHISDGKNVSRATVEIRRVNEAEARQFEIVRLMATNWMAPGTSDSES